MRSAQQAWLGLVFAGLIGCGNGNSVEIVNVMGRVTLDDQPLEKGLIQFLPTDGSGSSAASEIRQGKYQANMTIGKKRVEVTSPKVIGKQKAYDTPDSPVMDLLEEQIPVEYNAKSQLNANVSREQKAFDFTLKSKSPDDKHGSR